jgi:DNA primase
MPHISKETVDQVAAASDIVAVIGSYFPLAQAGTEFKGICPFHHELTPSFSVNPSKQSYYCHGCGAEGSVFQFVMQYENVEFLEAVRRLASRAGTPDQKLDRPLTLKEASEYLQLTPRTVRDLCQRRKLSHVRINYRHWRFRLADLDSYLAKRTVVAK